MKELTNKLLLLLCSLFTVPTMHSVILVTGGTGTTAGQTSNAAFQNRAFHEPSGTLFLGTAVGASNNSIVYVSRPATTDTTITASGIAADTNLQNKNISNLTVVSNPTNPGNQNLINIVATAGTTPTALYLITTTAGTAVTKTLDDVTNTETTGAILAIKGGNPGGTLTSVFSAVKVHGAATNFGAAVGDGISSVVINNSTLGMTANTPVPLNTTLTAYDLAITLTGITTTGNPCMAYDQDLNRLYVGINSMTSARTPLAQMCSIAIFEPNTTTGVLTQLYPLSTAATAPITGNNIIGVIGSAQTISAQHIAVMSSSNGPNGTLRYKYLIVNGGNGSVATTSQNVYAVPLTVGNATDANNGRFAAVTTGNFGSPAANTGDLYLTSSAAAQVGNGPLPAVNAGQVADMHVSGDTVYVSINAAGAAGNVSSSQTTGVTTGIFTSQAFFNQNGQIAGWTNWHRIAPTALGTASDDGTATGRTSLIAVDAVTGHIAAVDGANNEALRFTQWQTSSYDEQDGALNTKGLVYNLNQVSNVGDSCTAVCDLNSTTTAWGTVTPMRMALFGGREGKVCFAMTGSAFVASSAALNTSNLAVEHSFGTDASTLSLDYSSTNTLLLTTLPTGAGTVRSLAYTGWYPVGGNTTNGFFLAGAETGAGNGALYVFAQPTLGVGYNYRKMGNLEGSPFVGHTGLTNPSTWQHLTGCDGIPVKIQALGGAVYILTRKLNTDGTSLDRIFRLINKPNAAALNTSFIVTATAGAVNGAVNLSAVNHIYDFAVTQTGTGHEQLSMVTNDGLYTTTSSAGCDAAGYNNNPADAMLNCGWVKVTSPATAEGFMLKIFQPTHTRVPQTFWASQWQQNDTNSAAYDGNGLGQYGRATYNATPPFGEDQWINFNAYTATLTLPAGLVQLPVVTQFYSDGLRRLYTTITSAIGINAMQAYTVPYRVDANIWNRTSPTQIGDSAVSNLGAVYWITPVAGTLMMGTSNGVVALQ